MKIIPYNSCQVPEGLHLLTPQVMHDFYTSVSPTATLMDRHCLSSLWTSQHLCHFLFTKGCSALQRGLCWLGEWAFEKFHCFFFSALKFWLWEREDWKDVWGVLGWEEEQKRGSGGLNIGITTLWYQGEWSLYRCLTCSALFYASHIHIIHEVLYY